MKLCSCSCLSCGLLVLLVILVGVFFVAHGIPGIFH